MKRKITAINQLLILSMLVSIMIICFSCENESDTDLVDKPNVEMEKQKVQIKNGMLVFSSMQELDKAATALHAPQNGEYNELRNFRSQKNIFDQIVLAEDEFIEECLKLPEAEIKQINPAEAHSDIYLEMRKKGIIKEFEEEDGMSYDYALCDPIYASVVNEEGFVAVGDTIIYIGETKVVRGDNLELRNANNLKSATETDSLAKVYVLNTDVETRSTNEKYPQVKYADTFRDGKKYRYSLHLHFDLSSFLLSQGYYKQMNYRYYIAVKSKKQKALFGGYNYRSCSAVLTGSSDSESEVAEYVSAPRYRMTGYTSLSHSTTVSNTIFRLSFWKNINTDQFWTWDSVHSLSFSIGSTYLGINYVYHFYNYKCVFEGNNVVNMSGSIMITPPKSVVTY